MGGCPPEPTLRQLGSDDLGDAEFLAIERHVESCDSCRGVLERLARSGEPVEPGPRRFETGLPELPGFEVERELGRGGAGVVYLAREPRLDRPVALKVVPGGAVGGDRARARWIAEARAVSRLRHPNVVRLYRVEETPQWWVLVFEYIPGGTLRDRLGSGPVAPRDAAALVETVARAVAHIHRRGLLHLDLKPSNILLDGEPGAPFDRVTPKVSDFGIARATQDDPHAPRTTIEDAAGGLRGTPTYMAPEQAGPPGEAIGPAADVHALGALLYHLLAGRPPFVGASLLETLEKIRHQAPASPRRIDRRVPRELARIALECLRKDPARRYPSALALADDLRRWLDGRPPAWPGRGGRGLSRALVLAACGVAAALGVAGHESPRPASAAADEAQSSSLSSSPSRSLPEFQGWIRQLIDDPRRLDGDGLAAFVAESTRQARRLRDDPSVDAEGLASLGVLVRVLADRIASEDLGFSPARTLLDLSRELISAGLGRRPDDQEALWELALTIRSSAGLLGRDRHLFGASLDQTVDRALADFAEVERLAAGLASPTRRSSLYWQLSDDRREIGYQYSYRDRVDLGRRVLEADLAMFAQLDDDDLAIPDLRIRRALTRAALGGEAPAPPAEADNPAWLAPNLRPVLIREWIAAPIARALFLEADRPAGGWLPDPDRRGVELLESVAALCRDAGLPETELAEACLNPLTLYVNSAGAAFRKQRRAAIAERMERRFLALACALARRLPDRAMPFMVLSEAHVQAAKNAFHRDDTALAVEQLRLSRDDARRAAGLEPNLGATRDLVEDRERRLARSLSE